MKRTIRRFFYVLLIVLTFVSCTDKRVNAMSELEAFTEELTTNATHYTDEDWDIAQNQFDVICEELEQYDYTDEELKQIGKLKGRCKVVFAKRAASDFSKSLHRFSKEMEGFFEGITND